jgi:hypothetical protein
MDDAKRMALLRRHWDNASTDPETTHEIYHEDAVLEFPQSRERFVGKENYFCPIQRWTLAVRLQHLAVQR